MMRLRRLISLFLVIALCLFQAGVVHAEEQPLLSLSLPAFEASDERIGNVPPETLKAELFAQLVQCPRRISVAKYRIPNEKVLELMLFIRHEIPEAFHIDFENLEYLPGSRYVDSIYFSYLFTEEQYRQKLEAVRDAAYAMTADLKGLSQVQQALLLHDRIALSCTYPQTPYRSNDYSIYGALVEKRAVCQGYALSYQYLLELLSVESEICTSETLNHAWNIVTVDGRQYHVDVTWDDGYDIDGIVMHDHFLRSTAGIIESGHTADDFNTAPADTTYDRAFWQNSDAAFMKLRNEVYYIDFTKAAICRWNGTSVLKLGTVWPATGGYYPGCYSTLSCDGTYLLFAEYGSIYRFDPVTGVRNAVFTPNYSGNAVLNIYGFKLEDATLSCTLSDAPYPILGMDLICYTSTPYQIPIPFTTADAVTIMQYLIGCDVTLDWGIMDRNQDQSISIADAVLILRTLAD